MMGPGRGLSFLLRKFVELCRVEMVYSSAFSMHNHHSLLRH